MSIFSVLLEKVAHTLNLLLLPPDAAAERDNKIEERRRKRKSRWEDVTTDDAKISCLQNVTVEHSQTAPPSLVRKYTVSI